MMNAHVDILYSKYMPLNSTLSQFLILWSDTVIISIRDSQVAEIDHTHIFWPCRMEGLCRRWRYYLVFLGPNLVTMIPYQ